MDDVGVIRVFLQIGREERADSQDQQAPLFGVGDNVFRQTARDALAFERLGHQGLGDHQIGFGQVVGDHGHLIAEGQFVAVQFGGVADGSVGHGGPLEGCEQDLQGKHIRRQRGFETQRLAGHRMNEAEN